MSALRGSRYGVPSSDSAAYKRARHNAMSSDERFRYNLKQRCEKHHISISEYDAIWKMQRGCCAFCHEPMDYFAKRGSHIDHSHLCCPGSWSCGECIRGIVHPGCNHWVALADAIESGGGDVSDFVNRLTEYAKRRPVLSLVSLRLWSEVPA